MRDEYHLYYSAEYDATYGHCTGQLDETGQEVRYTLMLPFGDITKAREHCRLPDLVYLGPGRWVKDLLPTPDEMMRRLLDRHRVGGRP